MSRPLRGMVLAAGLGTRLRPLTDLFPKPLMPFAGTTPLTLALYRLGLAGVEHIAINSHHLYSQISDYIGVNFFGQKLVGSYEPELLGTGGCYNPLRKWIGNCDLIVLNGDIVSAFDVGELIAHHRNTRSLATMVLLPNVIPGEMGVLHKDGKVVGFSREASTEYMRGNFACIQILSPEFLDLLPTSGVFDVITKGYMPALKQGLPIGAVVYKGFWHDLRTPLFYWGAVLDLLSAKDAFVASGVEACRKKRGLTTERTGNILYDSTVRIAPTARLHGNVICEPGSLISDHADVRDSLLLPGAIVQPGSVEEDVILAPGTRLTLGAGA